MLREALERAASFIEQARDADSVGLSEFTDAADEARRALHEIHMVERRRREQAMSTHITRKKRDGDARN